MVFGKNSTLVNESPEKSLHLVIKQEHGNSKSDRDDLPKNYARQKSRQICRE